MQGKYKALWLNKDGNLEVLDQRFLPFEERIITISDTDGAIKAIKNMTVRGAGIIGNVAAFGVYLTAKNCGGNLAKIEISAKKICKSRPTAVNLSWAIDRMLIVAQKSDNIIEDLRLEAIKIADEDSKKSKKIAKYGADLIEKIMKKKNLKYFNILTHCNAGWLAIIDDGTALAPIYEAKKRGIDIRVWVDETRPRNQGANLTAWELSKANIAHTVIADNTGGHLMQNNMVDMVITGADRVAKNADSANKIGTYLKALAAKDNNVPFYIALPSSTFDFNIINGVKDIPIEVRDGKEVRNMRGLDKKGKVKDFQIIQSNSPVVNYGFDVTPARLITRLITERGLCKANKNSITKMFKDLM